jgi:hypothetical protein
MSPVTPRCTGQPLGKGATTQKAGRDGAEEALPTRSKLGSPTPPTHAPKAGQNSATPTSNGVMCAGQAMGRQYMKTSQPATHATRRPSRPPDRQKARRPPNHRLRPRRSPRARPIPRNTTNPRIRGGTPRHRNPHQDRRSSLPNRNPPPHPTGGKGANAPPRPENRQAEHYEAPRRRPCAKRRKTTLTTPKKDAKP